MGLKPRVTPPSKTTLLRFREGGSDKFWQITLDGNSATTRWGRTGTGGQAKTKRYGSVELLQADATKQIQSKLKKGYAVEPLPRPRSFSPDVIEPVPGLSMLHDDRKGFKADLRLGKAKVNATLLISKEKGYDATAHNRTIHHFVSNQTDILAALRDRGYRDYLANRDYILEDWDIQDAARELPTVTSVAQIDRAIDFATPEINLHSGFGNISIRCRNTWDVEHQYTVLLSEFAIVDTDCLGEGVRHP